MIGQPFARTSATLVDIRTTRLDAPHCEKLKSYLAIPAFNLARLDWIGASVICCQLNYTLPGSFRIVGWKSLHTLDPLLRFSLCVKWRVGHVVYRYRLYGASGETSLFVPNYTGELIHPQFSLECWSSFLYNTLVVSETLLIKINKLAYPASCHDFSYVSFPNVTFCDDELYIFGTSPAIPNQFSLCSTWYSNGSGITWGSTDVSFDESITFDTL